MKLQCVKPLFLIALIQFGFTGSVLAREGVGGNGGGDAEADVIEIYQRLPAFITQFRQNRLDDERSLKILQLWDKYLASHKDISQTITFNYSGTSKALVELSNGKNPQDFIWNQYQFYKKESGKFVLDENGSRIRVLNYLSTLKEWLLILTVKVNPGDLDYVKESLLTNILNSIDQYLKEEHDLINKIISHTETTDSKKTKELILAQRKKLKAPQFNQSQLHLCGDIYPNSSTHIGKWDYYLVPQGSERLYRILSWEETPDKEAKFFHPFKIGLWPTMQRGCVVYRGDLVATPLGHFAFGTEFLPYKLKKEEVHSLFRRTQFGALQMNENGKYTLVGRNIFSVTPKPTEFTFLDPQIELFVRQKFEKRNEIAVQVYFLNENTKDPKAVTCQFGYPVNDN